MKNILIVQGVGNFVNVAVIIILLVCFNQIKPGNGPGRAGHGYSASVIKGGVKTTVPLKYRPNALSGAPMSFTSTNCVPGSHNSFALSHPVEILWGIHKTARLTSGQPVSQLHHRYELISYNQS